MAHPRPRARPRPKRIALWDPDTRRSSPSPDSDVDQTTKPLPIRQGLEELSVPTPSVPGLEGFIGDVEWQGSQQVCDEP